MMVVMTMIACGQDELAMPEKGGKVLKIVVDSYPLYGEDSRVIGTPDPGKSEWENGDVILVSVTDGSTSNTLTLTYDNNTWSQDQAVEVSESATFKAIYAPGCLWNNGALALKDATNSPYGTFEYMEGDCTYSNNSLSISFVGKRDYSRLRVVPGVSNAEVVVTEFTPAGAEAVNEKTYSVTTDEKGNAYLYGSWAANGRVKIELNENEESDHTFTSATTAGKSYAFGMPEYITFTAESSQTFKMTQWNNLLTVNLQYSVNGAAWESYTMSSEVAFGGENGTLRLRGVNPNGTAIEDDFLSIEFIDDVDVACTGDIRTLVDYTDYGAAETGSARFNALFEGCTNLVSAPKLPATVLADQCYSRMFAGTSLVKAPALPATELAKACYLEMFLDCYSLVEAPALPAMTMASACYAGMFSNCTSLVELPELPAETMASACYAGMFEGCTSVTSAPELPALIMAPNCYESMFSGCTSLSEAPELPANTLAKECYMYMFSSTALTSAPELNTKSLEEGCYKLMFWNCTSLTKAPKLLPATELAKECYSEMFKDCIKLTGIPSGLPAIELAEKCYYAMFYGCKNIEGAPELPAETMVESCYAQMFRGCERLENAPELPATILAKECYSEMFEYCIRLKKSPVLAASALADGCYAKMFNGCSVLAEVSMLATENVNDTNLSSWLDAVSKSGTFYKKSGTTLSEGKSGIPTGWTVVEK